MSIRQINCTFDRNGILSPVASSGPNTTVALVNIQGDQVTGKTGTISYAGSVRAFLTFDHLGLRVESYTLTVQDYATQVSVENIVRVI
ncbi:hypothetical protein OBP_150 [Pseudomonas phage OBP]|uniref:hypothetical protein n=1 Tax=Pseudomonas phage OBP TaxID=1124849 RepID=UPI000240D56B|nr:hypothetical protein OBP_150 [Pseudomonas phage OBP]AEV89587.1 hypothetical protein OBP_150 [Pseudomonas phage OBP]